MLTEFLEVGESELGVPFDLVLMVFRVSRSTSRLISSPALDNLEAARIMFHLPMTTLSIRCVLQHLLYASLNLEIVRCR